MTFQAYRNEFQNHSRGLLDWKFFSHVYNTHNVLSFIAVPKISVVETTSNDITNDTICSHHGSRLPIGFLWRLWFSLAVCLLYWCPCYSILHPVLRILRQKLPHKKEVQEGKKMNRNSELFDLSFDGISACKNVARTL